MLVGGKFSRWGQLAKRCIQAKAGVSSSFMLQMADSGTSDTIISPFAPGEAETSTSTDGLDDDDELELTRDNVELVLDEMRPFLKADGYDFTLIMTVRKYSKRPFNFIIIVLFSLSMCSLFCIHVEEMWPSWRLMVLS